MEMKKIIYNKEESKPSHAVTEICNSLLSTDRGYETKSRLETHHKSKRCTFIVIKKKSALLLK